MAKGAANKAKNQNDAKIREEINKRITKFKDHTPITLEEAKRDLNELKQDFSGVSLSGGVKTVRFEDVMGSSLKGTKEFRLLVKSFEKFANTHLLERMKIIKPKLEAVKAPIEQWLKNSSESQEKKNAAKQLMTDLKNATNTFIDDGDREAFKTSCDEAVKKAEHSSLNQSPNWREGVLPALKQFANLILSLFTSNTSFFKNEGQVTLKDTVEQINQSLLDDTPDAQPSSPAG